MSVNAISDGQIPFRLEYTASLIAAGDAEVGHNSRNEGPASVMVNGEKANTTDKLLYTSESRCLLAWPSWLGQTHDCVSGSHLVMLNLLVKPNIALAG